MASWGSQAYLSATLLVVGDVLELDYENEGEVIPELLASEDDDEDRIFIPSPKAAKPDDLLAHQEGKRVLQKIFGSFGSFRYGAAEPDLQSLVQE